MTFQGTTVPSQRAGRFIGDFVSFDVARGNTSNVLPQLVVETDPATEGRPFARHFHSAVWYGGHFYVFGGKSNGYHNDLWRAAIGGSTSPLQWKMVKHVSDIKLFARFGQSAVLWGGAMYVFGGYDQHGFCCNEMDTFVFARNAWAKESPVSGTAKERYHHSAVVHGRAMYVFGGRSDNESLGDVVEYHFDTRTWTSITTTGAPPSKRWGHSACVVGDKMYVFGGCDGTSCFGDLHEYDFGTRQWSLVDVPHCPAPRYFQWMCCVDNERILIVGGKDLWGRCFDEVHEFRVGGMITGGGSAPSTLGGTGSFGSGGGGGSVGGSGGGGGGGGSDKKPFRSSLKISPQHQLMLQQQQQQALSLGDKVRLKLHFEEEVRLVVVPRSIPFEGLLSKLREQYDQTISFRYRDEEDDLITVRSQEDWEEALACMGRLQQPSQSAFKVYLDNLFSLRRNSGMRQRSVASPRRSVSGAGTPRAGTPRADSPQESPNALSRALNMIVDAGIKSPPPLRAPGPFVAAKWKKGEMVGSGAFGDVFKVMHVDTGELAAMKAVRLASKEGGQRVRKVVESLMQEIALMQDLEHPNIVRYLGSEEKQDTLNIFMEYVSGGSIASMLQRFGKFPERVICNFTKQILQGLSYLHETRIIHRDLKGGNILVTPAGVVKLGDFGASKRLLDICTVTDAGANTMTGTPYWMAPEVIRGNMNYGRKADVWSVGICVIEMAAGKPPFADLGPVTALFKIGSTDQPPPYPEILSTLAREFLDCCLARDPKKRLSALELILHGWIEQGGINQGEGEVAQLLGGGGGGGVVQNKITNNKK